ncbi:hypothetical protein CBR_g708 [Chara braunii]|uniref:Sugar phosphate transporter domain-containing protein n=1 Tax=Chara braunii TaxID=69332 RepID=A0A388KC18_CHABU|nr:hypothetical protein CBR_g708 [Chara braunii]|eukprot:GBG67579.1 hypothetical protein CBR_g708 [Chara braunii]
MADVALAGHNASSSLSICLRRKMPARPPSGLAAISSGARVTGRAIGIVHGITTASSRGCRQSAKYSFDPIGDGRQRPLRCCTKTKRTTVAMAARVGERTILNLGTAEPSSWRKSSSTVTIDRRVSGWQSPAHCQARLLGAQWSEEWHARCKRGDPATVAVFDPLSTYSSSPFRTMRWRRRTTTTRTTTSQISPTAASSSSPSSSSSSSPAIDSIAGEEHLQQESPSSSSSSSLDEQHLHQHHSPSSSSSSFDEQHLDQHSPFSSSSSFDGQHLHQRSPSSSSSSSSSSFDDQHLKQRSPSSSSSSSSAAAAAAGTHSPFNNPALITGFFFLTWYILNVSFNILNKRIYNYFPHPWFVSTVHLFVGTIYCIVCWSTGLMKSAPVTSDQIKALIPVAMCHAFGHVMSNVSFSSVAVSFTHTIKALEPFFSATASQLFLGQSIPLPIWMSLAPVVLGVSLASASELSFTWIGFASAMSSNVAFTYRNIVSKKVMAEIDSTNLYAYVSMISLALLLLPALVMESSTLGAGINAAVSKVGLLKFGSDLVIVGLLYHLYNQIACNTLERVAPLTHAVGNVLKRVFVIGSSILFFGNRISLATGIGTAVAIAGVATYSILKAQSAEKKRKLAAPAAG